MRGLLNVVIGLGLAGGQALAQSTMREDVPAAANSAAALTDEVEDDAWAVTLSATTYLVPDDRDYVQPTLTADRGRLHLEARFNYEDLDTGSVWVGYNFSAGNELTLELTPILGVVFGATDGIAPGWKSTLGWRKLELYSEGEYVLDTGDSADSFFYTWSELALAPVDWLRFGLVVQRTKVYETDFDIQRGVLVGFSYKRVDFTAYVFNPDANPPTVVLGVVLDLGP